MSNDCVWRLKGLRCPECNAKLDGIGAQTDAGSRPPMSGDLTFCMYCTAVLVLTECLDFRKATEWDLGQIDPAARTLLEQQRETSKLVISDERRRRARETP